MGNLQCGEIPGAYLTNAFFELKGYQGQSPWLVSTDCDQPALTIRPSCWRAVTPSSRPTSSTILPFLSLSTVVPVKCIFRPVAAGNDPTRKSLNAEPVCVPPPSQRPTT